MTPTQYKIFVWCYTLFDTAIAGAATAFLVEVSRTAQGGVFNLRQAAWTAVLAGIVNGVMYLRKSPLPQLIVNRQGSPAEPVERSGPPPSTKPNQAGNGE